VIRVDKVELASGSAEIYVLEQRNGGLLYRKQLLGIGGGGRTAVVIAMCEETVAAKWEPLLRASLLTVRLSSEEAPNVGGFLGGAKGWVS
jgi:hypothetical protein